MSFKIDNKNNGFVEFKINYKETENGKLKQKSNLIFQKEYETKEIAAKIIPRGWRGTLERIINFFTGKYVKLNVKHDGKPIDLLVKINSVVKQTGLTKKEVKSTNNLESLILGKVNLDPRVREIENLKILSAKYPRAKIYKIDKPEYTRPPRFKDYERNKRAEWCLNHFRDEFLSKIPSSSPNPEPKPMQFIYSSWEQDRDFKRFRMGNGENDPLRVYQSNDFNVQCDERSGDVYAQVFAWRDPYTEDVYVLVDPGEIRYESYQVDRHNPINVPAKKFMDHFEKALDNNSMKTLKDHSFKDSDDFYLTRPRWLSNL